jgi:hypothetical protein
VWFYKLKICEKILILELKTVIIRGSCTFVHSTDLTFKKLKGPWLFRTPASFPSTVKGFSAEETKASFPDHSIEFTHLEFPGQMRTRFCHVRQSKNTIYKNTVVGKNRLSASAVLSSCCYPSKTILL